MGLPLFVEPVQSDLRDKPSAKRRATSPSNSDSWRPGRPAPSERRNVLRRAGVRIYGPHAGNTQFRPPGSTSNTHGGNTSGEPPVHARTHESSRDPESSNRPALHEVLQDMRQMNNRDSRLITEHIDRIDRMIEWTDSRLGDISWPLPVPPPPAAQSSSAGRVTRNRRPRVPLSPHANGRLSSDPDGPVTLPQMHSHDGSHRVEGTVEVPAAIRARLASVRSNRGLRTHSRRRLTRPDDGLGDRNRSPTPPEGWDTLLSTLTEDAQTPSAGSLPTSQPAESLSFSGPHNPHHAPESTQEGVSVEAACESGGDCSDSDMADVEATLAGLRARRRRQDAESAVVPRRGRFDSEERLSIREFLSRRSRTADREATRDVGALSRWSFPESPFDMSQEDSTLALLPTEPTRRTDSGNDDGDAGQEELFGAPTYRASATTEDDLTGMQHIVRSLARREDIPDGWWAEAGLSRLLRQGDIDSPFRDDHASR